MKPSRANPLPKQEGRKSEALLDALDNLRRQQNARPVPLRVTWSRAADSAAGDTSTDAVYVSPSRLKLERVDVVCETSETANATDYATLTLQAYNAEGDQTTRKLASFTTAESGFVAYRRRGFALERADVPAGWIIRLLVTKAGAGVALGRIHVYINAEENRR